MAAIIQERFLIVWHTKNTIQNKILNNWLNKETRNLFRCHRDDDIVGQPYRQRLRDQLIGLLKKRGRGSKSGGHLEFHFITPPPTAHCLLPRQFWRVIWKKGDGMGSIQFAVVFSHMIGDTSCPFINAIFYKSTRTEQFPGMSCLLVRVDGVGWGWWDHCGWLRLDGWDLSILLFCWMSFSIRITINSTHFCSTGDEINKCDDS